MRKLLAFSIALWMLMAGALSAMAEGEPARYTGVPVQDLTIRATKSQSGKRVGKVLAGQTIEIISLERDWFLVRDGDAEGYVVAGLVGELEALDPDDPVPPNYLKPNPKTFRPFYRAKASGQISMRLTPEEDGKLVATLYEKDLVELNKLAPEWTVVKKGKKLGYVRTESLTALETLDPYRGLSEGEKVFPYAARLMAPHDVTGTMQSQLGVLQSLPVGAVVPVGEPDQNGDVLMPYKRTVGQLSGDALELVPVMSPEDALPGDLIGVFATFFTADEDRDIIVGRLHNLQMGVDFFDGCIVEAGDTFSFNATAAPYNRDKGYKVGPIINYVSDKKTGYGGGICQVSTTLYNVLLQLPVEIGRWQTHSSYGIDYAPVEFDAAVGKGDLDLRFVNTLPYAIHMKMDLWDGVITVRIYRDGDIAADPVAPQAEEAPIEEMPIGEMPIGETPTDETLTEETAPEELNEEEIADVEAEG